MSKKSAMHGSSARNASNIKILNMSEIFCFEHKSSLSIEYKLFKKIDKNCLSKCYKSFVLFLDCCWK